MDYEVDDKVLDKLYENIDDLFWAGKFEEVNSLLENLDIANAPLDILLGYLTATLLPPDKAKLAKLTYRETFYKEVRENLLSRSWDDENLEGRTVEDYIDNRLLIGLEFRTS